jgi:hypothetical protein
LDLTTTRTALHLVAEFGIGLEPEAPGPLSRMRASPRETLAKAGSCWCLAFSSVMKNVESDKT